MSSLYKINYQLRAHKRDPFIEFIKSMLMTPFVLHAKPRFDVSSNEDTKEKPVKVEANEARFADILEQDHRRKTELGVREHSRLSRLVPSIGNFFTSLPLKESFLKVNKEVNITSRRFVPPSFNEIRMVLNVAQVDAISPKLRLATFDGDMTLYADGQDFEKDSALVNQIIQLLQQNIFVAVVTAAGYGDDAKRYEGRLSGLLDGFRNSNLTLTQLQRFYVFGGECNYLFRCEEGANLKFITEQEYFPESIPKWSDAQVEQLLDIAEKNVRRCAEEMHLKSTIIRKSRAVGLIPQPGVQIKRELLDECVLSTQAYLLEKQRKFALTGATEIPFCAFNGGSDVWCDIGNKLIGVTILQKYLGAGPDQTLHFGDQFLSTGNDYATRSACCTSWIVSPEETQLMLQLLLDNFAKL